MIRTIHFFLALYLLSIAIGFSQGEVPIGNWQSHLSLREGVWVTQSPNKVIYSTGSALVSIDKQTMEPSFTTKIDGLSEVPINKIFFDPNNQQLMVIYQNSNIDIVTNESIINISAIIDNQSITGVRRVNDVHFVSRSSCFMATTFGIVEFDPERLQFRGTTFTDFPVLSVSSDANFIYAGSIRGIYRINRDNPNKLDLGRWTFLGPNFGLPTTYACTSMATYGGALYMINDNRSYILEGETAEEFDFDTPPTATLAFLQASNGKLMLGFREPNFRSGIRVLNPDESITSGGAECTNVLFFAIEDQQGRIWYADQFRGFRHSQGPNGPCQRAEYDSPLTNSVSQVVVADKIVFCASGGIPENFTYGSNRAGFYYYQNGTWQNRNDSNVPGLGLDFINMASVAADPAAKTVYVGSYYDGILAYNYQEGTPQFFNKDTPDSRLQGRAGDPQRTTVSALKTDEEGNLWIANFEAPRPIVLRTKDGQWANFGVPGSTSLSKMEIDDRGYIWFVVVGNSSGVLVYDPGSNLLSPSDDRYRFLNSNNTEMTTNVATSVRKDLGGGVWVGTEAGPVVFDCDVFSTNSNCRGSRRRVVQDGIPAILLETENIQAIGVYGANRKWFGTRNGVFFQSADGVDQVLRLRAENSPLFDNQILDLTFNDDTGEMYIVTSLGLQSYRTESTRGGDRHRDVYAYPNPVRPEYDGIIAIRGLYENANVKITDVNGKLVHETTALGGQAVWNGRDYNGRNVATGVYLVFSAGGSQLPDSFVTKIMIIR